MLEFPRALIVFDIGCYRYRELLKSKSGTHEKTAKILELTNETIKISNKFNAEKAYKLISFITHTVKKTLW